MTAENEPTPFVADDSRVYRCIVCMKRIPVGAVVYQVGTNYIGAECLRRYQEEHPHDES